MCKMSAKNAARSFIDRQKNWATKAADKGKAMIDARTWTPPDIGEIQGLLELLDNAGMSSGEIAGRTAINERLVRFWKAGKREREMTFDRWVKLLLLSMQVAQQTPEPDTTVPAIGE